MTTLVRPSRIKSDFIFDPSLALYLPLYELDGASFVSRDAYGYLCTITGASWKLRGYKFDGVDDYGQAPSYFGDINFLNQAITLEVVFKLDAGIAAGGILGISPATATNLGIQIITSNTNIWVVWVRRDGDVTGRVPLLAGDILSYGQWYHLIVSYDGNGTPDDNTVQFTLNGVDRPLSTSGQRHFWDVDNVVRIGSQALTGPGGMQEPIDGQIGLVTIFDTNLTTVQMTGRFNQVRHLIGV